LDPANSFLLAAMTWEDLLCCSAVWARQLD
jgi:hypothetical protein